jgi:glycerol-3-phosphate dehydrogenase
VEATDLESGAKVSVAAKVVINATGPFSDAVRRLADPNIVPMISPSQGIHLVFDHSFLPGDSAIMVPHTSDGRVMFAIPWHGHILVGTTDTPITDLSLEPRAFPEEISFILETAASYLHKAPSRADVLSVFVGIRPLVSSGGGGNTSQLSRDHSIRIDNSGLLTIAGGKWTTYRHMAEDCINQAAMLGRLPEMPSSTQHLTIHGFHKNAAKFEDLSVYGSEASGIQDLIREDPVLGERLHPALTYFAAEVVWATRVEMARTVEDVLARRTRALFLNAKAAMEIAPRVAQIMARELQQGSDWQAEQVKTFRELAWQYMIPQ